MLYRINAVFNVSKTRAAVVSMLCFVAGLVLLLIPNLAVCGGALFFYSFVYGCIWFFKFNRDQRIVEQAKLHAETEPVQQVIDMTSPGSSRLFVPPPLDRPE